MEFKFGHRVIATDGVCGSWEKGRFVSYTPGLPFPYKVLIDKDSEPQAYEYCALDPDAKEFLPGDKVEVSDDKEEWFRAEFSFLDTLDDCYAPYFAKRAGMKMAIWHQYCRYPKESAKDEKIAELQVKVDGLYNEVSNQLGYFCQKFDKLQDELNRIK